MALSKPQLGTQSPIQCQLCEQDPKISWKCVECELLMCSLCKNNIHPKIKTAGEHRIISIKDIGNTLLSNKGIGSTPGSTKDCTNVDLTVVGEYKTNLDSIFQLAISLDDSLWISDGVHKKGIRFFAPYTGLQKVKCEGNKLKVISNFNIHIYCLAITHDNDLLIATEGPILKQIKSGTNKIIDTVFDLTPYEPVSIHITRQNKIIVGAYDDGKGMVIAMDHKGKHDKIYDECQNKGISFNVPWRITATSNDNIFVSDMSNQEYEGRVVVMGPGDFINTYSGHPDINTENRPFSPSDLTTTPADNVIIVDDYSRSLHILNTSGELITHISTKDTGIVENPFCIGLAMAGHFCMLYIGTLTEQGNTEKVKLYKLNLKGCK
ncbi:uncharacterized protein [Mytilus edulis]|uniref:uncharacterized protein n=1 Tax=Mytilus edulis TaxID=6550 RepID=UPI0039EF61E4